MKTLKLSQDQILEALTEYYAGQYEFGKFSSKADIFGNPGKDLRVVVVIGTEKEIDNVLDIDLNQLDETLPIEEIPEWADAARWIKEKDKQRS